MPREAPTSFAESRGSQTVCRIFHTFFFADNIAADRCKSAARILDEGTDNHVCPDLNRLTLFHEFAVAVVDHADHVRFDVLDECDQFSDALHRERLARCISLGTLDGDKMRALVDGGADAFIVKLSVRKQIHRR